MDDPHGVLFFFKVYQVETVDDIAVVRSGFNDPLFPLVLCPP